MSNAAEAVENSGATPAGPPISADFLPPNMRKHVDPKAPVPLRMMAAKGLVPLSPSDMAGALYLLTFDPDPQVREAVEKTAKGLPDRILSVALRDESVKPRVLGHFLDVLADNDTYQEMLVLNASTPDEAIASAARRCSARIAELIGQNQLRVLRHEDIVRQLCENPNATVTLTDSVCDFAVRNGVVLDDVPQIQQARVRIFGENAVEPDPGPTAEEILAENPELTQEGDAPFEEGKKLTLTQRIMKMNVAQKIKLATLGNKETRGMLLRDSNKLVAVAVVRSPRLTDGEVLSVANNRALPDDVLRIIYTNREWLRSYPIKLALVKNPKVPLAIAMKLLSSLRESEVRELSRNRNVPNGVQVLAKKMMSKKSGK